MEVSSNIYPVTSAASSRHRHRRPPAARAASEVEIRVCVNRSCARQGSREVLEALSGLAPPDITIASCGCLGRCGAGPNLAVLPRETMFSHCGTAARAVQLLADLCGPRFDPQRNLEALALRKKGELDLEQGNASKAESLLSQAIDLEPSGGLHFLYGSRSAARLAMGHHANALRDAQEGSDQRMDRIQLLLLGFPIFLFCSDLVNLFTPAPPPPPKAPIRRQPPPPIHQAPDFSAAAQVNPHIAAAVGGGYGTTVELKFCASCSYRGNAETMKKMLETSFPGIDVILTNYPPILPKRALSKLVPLVQVGVFGIVMAGDQIFPRLGMAPPPWYFSLRANRFGTIATTWLLGNFAQSFLQSSGAFEVYCNGDLVFSKLKEHRFPGEFELKKLIGDRLPESAFGKNLGTVWS